MKTHTSNPISFTVNDVDGKLLPHIKHCFLDNVLINIENPPATIRQKNGVIYQAVYDNFFFELKITVVKCIGSFQITTEGNFVVIRPILTY